MIFLYQTPKALGALASRYRKILGTELMVKATRMVVKPKTSNDPQETAINEAQDPEPTEASVERS